eukprot:GFUD01020881.1.p1 GENE.GFUD01020881.1~~GFUD01020881.1.p1  ORF type:complete len:349 (+),score=93.89 GFUD01020881.1:58-1104(+)
MELMEALIRSSESDELKESVAYKLVMNAVNRNPMSSKGFRNDFHRLTNWIISSDHRYLRQTALKGLDALMVRDMWVKQVVDPSYFESIFCDMTQTKPVDVIGLIITIFSKFQKNGSLKESLIPLFKPVRTGLVLYLGHHGNNSEFKQSLAQLYNMFPSLLPVTNQDVTPLNTGTRNGVTSKIFEDMVFSDFRVVCNGRYFPCHKVFLAAQSSVFKKMFDSNMKEATEEMVELINFTEVVAESFVKFFYTGQVDKEVLNENIISFLDLGEKYNMNELKAVAEQVMITNLDKKNMLSFFLAGDLYRGQKIRTAAKTFLEENKKSLKETEGWKEALKERVDLLIELMEAFI